MLGLQDTNKLDLIDWNYFKIPVFLQTLHTLIISLEHS